MKLINTLTSFAFLFSFHLNATDIQNVTILADDSYPPYSFVENGHLTGIYVDIIKEASKLIDSRYKVNIIPTPWRRGLLAIKEGRAFALLPPYKHVEERSYIWPYSLAIMTEDVVAFCHKNVDLFEYTKPLSNKIASPLNVGINAGYLILNKELRQANKKGNIVIQENKSTRANILKLYTQRTDCYFNDRVSTLWELSRLSKKRKINFDNIRETLLNMTKTAHIGYSNSKAHNFAFKNDFVLQMDKALLKFISSDDYTKLTNRYGLSN